MKKYVIDDLLSLSRLSRHEIERKTVDLSEMAKEIMGELQERELERTVEVKIADGLVANCDAHLLRIVLENLLGNAFKFSSDKPKALIELGKIEQGGESKPKKKDLEEKHQKEIKKIIKALYFFMFWFIRFVRKQEVGGRN